MGLGKAVEIAMAELENNKKKETELRDYLIGRVMDEIPYTRLNGHRTNRLSNNANFAFQFIEGESLLIMLDMDGSAVPAVLHVLPDPWIRPMYCWPSDCRTRSRTDPYALP